MSSKRAATTDLNHDNWDREDEPEENLAGSYPTASESELKTRVIKRARRKITDDTGTSSTSGGKDATKSIFNNFAGFGKLTNTATAGAGSPFSFLPTAPLGNIFGTGSTTSTVKKPLLPVILEETVKHTKSSNFVGKLKQLNQSVSQWIQMHVEKNAMCILTPIFKDYEKHLEELEKEEEENKGNSKTESSTPSSINSKPNSVPSFFSNPPSTTKVGSVFGNKSTATNIFDSGTSTVSSSQGNNSTKTNGFVFGGATTTTTSAASTKPATGLPTFSFGKATAIGDDDKPSTSSFPFASNVNRFSFGNSATSLTVPPSAVTSTATKDDDVNDDDEPPKVEFKQVVEEDTVYSKKCKVFVKKDSNYVDRGVGTLYLKPVQNSPKTQLIVRADTSLGNILVNLILSAGLPVQRLGKNNVMMVCLPTPDEENPTTMLLRVKTGEEADELMATIVKYTK